MQPNYTVTTLKNTDVVFTALASPDREVSNFYCATRRSGEEISNLKSFGRIRDGKYEVRFFNPATMELTGKAMLESKGLRTEYELALPPFTDDLLAEIRLMESMDKSLIEGTR
jgi:hypothetical protein